MNREDLKVLPLAVLGIAKGIPEVIIKPFVVEETERVRHIAAAAIHYYRTGESQDE